MKEVTETTTLRVSHDTRLGIASYKVISNTLQNHHENVDVTEIKDLERIVSPDVHRKTNGLHHEANLDSKSEISFLYFSLLISLLFYTKIVCTWFLNTNCFE